MNVICDYCGKAAKLVKGDYIYPHRMDLYDLNFYFCNNDHPASYVGCHKGTVQPLGRLANDHLRYMKSQAHKAFDPLWKFGRYKRNGAYKWLAKELRINVSDCHIGMFDVDQCKKVIELCK